MGPAAQSMADRFGLTLTVIDVGWPGSAPMAWATTMGLLAIPIAIVVNILMLIARMTNVINVDIWNIWHLGFTGAIVHIATGSLLLAGLAVAVHAAISYKLGDIFSPVTDKYFHLDGIAMPHGSPVLMGLIAVPVEDLIDHVPGLRRINVSSEKMTERLGPLGRPVVIGAVLGLLIGFLAGYPVGEAATLAIRMGAVIVLMPMVVQLIVNGMVPIAKTAEGVLQRRFNNPAYRIGMDPALLLADPQVVSAGILFVPLTLLIAVVVPGNVVLPFGDLATIAFFVAIAVGIHHGNIFRTLISGTVIMAGTIWISSHMVDLQTRLAADTGLLGNADRVASLDQGGNPVTYVLANLLSGRVGAGVIVVLVLMVLAFGYSFLKYRRGTLFTPPREGDPAAPDPDAAHRPAEKPAADGSAA